MNRENYWTNEKLKEISTLGTAIEDWEYGFSTSFDGDSHKVINGNMCYCGERFEEVRENGRRLCGELCSKCRDEIRNRTEVNNE